jgi:V/A-type H+-transporting ATPase subunit I
MDRGLVIGVADPEPEENPPTLMKNLHQISSGQDLVLFYTTPQYWLWDPSVIVFFSFAIFFAMILADAGYSATLGVALAVLWKRMGRSEFGRRFRVLMTALVGAGVIYGVMVGSYLGVSPAEGALLSQVKILDMMDFNTMMMLSIVIGVLHLVVANAATAWHGRRSLQALVPTSWIFIFLGGLSIYLGSSGGEATSFLKIPGGIAIVLGLVTVVCFTSVEGSILRRLLQGLQGLTRLSNAFGDSLSYLRLFALGLASASLASTFNDLAGQVREAVPGIGLLFGLVIVILGHGMNFVLSLSSGVIHGLRLNLIEFLNWSISEEGYPFKAFARKEKTSWRT